MPTSQKLSVTIQHTFKSQGPFGLEPRLAPLIPWNRWVVLSTAFNNYLIVKVLVGCSGWSYDDWVGRFYPVELEGRKEEWLAYYSHYFKTVEINSTFYRVPDDHMVRSWVRKGTSFGDFEYSVKLPRVITHVSMDSGEPEKAARQAASFERSCIEPFHEAGILGAALIQLSPHVKYCDRAIGSLRLLLDSIRCDKFRYAVEFRHRSWLSNGRNRLREEVLDLLKDRGVTSVILDGPGFPMTSELTADHVYFRFHGRNTDLWFGKEAENDYRLNRYDYLYSEEELSRWISAINKMRNKGVEVRIYFNNHGRAKAVKNAFQLMDLLSIPHEFKEVRIQDQMKLGTYE